MLYFKGACCSVTLRNHDEVSQDGIWNNSYTTINWVQKCGISQNCTNFMGKLMKLARISTYFNSFIISFFNLNLINHRIFGMPNFTVLAQRRRLRGSRRESTAPFLPRWLFYGCKVGYLWPAPKSWNGRFGAYAAGSWLNQAASTSGASPFVLTAARSILS